MMFTISRINDSESHFELWVLFFFLGAGMKDGQSGPCPFVKHITTEHPSRTVFCFLRQMFYFL